MTSEKLNLLLEQTQDVAKSAGAFIRKERQHFDPNKIEHKGFNDLVSYVDKEAEKMIVDRLSKILPEAGFITEEGTSTTQAEQYNWVIDPLDGTTNFIHGIPVFSVSIALMEKEEVILGVVYEINLHECFYAKKGGGAFCNDTRISVSPAKNLSESLMVTGFPYANFDQVDKYLEVLKYMMQHTHGARRFGSAAVDLCYVASGRAEGFFEYNLNSYDVAAGTLIVEEAGGKVTDFSGGRNFVFGRQILASNAKIHEPVLSKLQEVWG
ncbi:inositol monophosphatase family protein [Algoriphagus halophytocola]|uniref:Inositol-1-monophosphatase n=1 Tax=Algoriphagus halophytocola TaxID=2991499 RepID=A0ABY6MDA2_9BACT|nr:MULTISPECIES: inositol monophosphatase family protein [unclassified Algoriphagus]UZD21690.1 inositol monophosphatase [Algoriphagus sp. TR-M5]WBL42902.1 inositol monophosphatase family protein [Algoriphagus sp. TR-M9]